MFAEERPPEERSPEEEETAPAEPTPTEQEDAAEPAGDQDASNEEERDPNPPRDEEQDYLALAQRTQADFENYRKRSAKEIAAAGKRAKGELVRELLPVVDNLERALGSAEEGEQHLAEGVKLVHSELVAVLERNGVEAFDPAGERFDPVEHEALSTRSEEGAKPGVVLDVVERGYRANGTILRPARVVVSG